MSIKTPKRLVLGLIASLVLAPFAAVAPASAATGDITSITAISSTGSGTTTATASQVAGPSNFVGANFEVLASEQYVITVSGGTASSATAGVTGSGTSSLTALPATGRTSISLTVPTPTVGTVTVSLFGFTSGALNSLHTSRLTITVVATNPVGIVKASTSTSVIKSGSTWLAGTSASTDDTVRASRNASATPIAAIRVDLAQESGPITGTTAVTASISGPGLLYLSDGADELHSTNTISTGRSVASTIAITGESFRVFVAPDGNSGVATITITAGTFTATETVTFFGAVASYNVVVNKAHVANSGAATSDVFRVTALDSAGVLVANATIHASVGTSTIGAVLASATTGASGEAAVFTATGLADKFGSVPVTFANNATLTSATVTATSAFGVSSVRAATLTVTSNKATYLPGEAMTLTFTANDANGLGLPNDTYAAGTLLANSASNPVPSVSFPAVPFAGNEGIALKAGVVTATVFAPLVEGPVNFVWTLAGTAGTATTNLAAALAGTKVTLAVTVARPAAPAPEPVYEKPTLSVAQSAGRVFLSGTAVEGEGDIIIYVKRVGTTAWKERAKTLEVAAPGDFNGSIKAPRGNVVIRVKQEGTGMFSNQVILVK